MRAASAASRGHVPVMCAEMCAAMDPMDGDILVDGTFGAGGYARALLDRADCRVIAFDRDPDAVARGAALAAAYGGRFELIKGRFGAMQAQLAARQVDAINGLVLDLGVSSMQVDEPERGFSFQSDGPLDMRMDRTGESAADVVNGYEEAALAQILFRLGEERKSRRIARAIVARRAQAPFTRTGDLAELVVKTLGPAGRAMARHPATKTFQALRIHVNRELQELDDGLAAAEQLLRPGGRLCVVTFHSLEDRPVKQFLAARARRAAGPSRHVPDGPAGPAPSFHLPRKAALTPSPAELAANPRARSAKLRLAVRTDAPAWPSEAVSP